jgi:hypothetical protein
MGMGSAEARGWLTYVWEIDAVDECEGVNHCECGEQVEIEFTDDTSCFRQRCERGRRRVGIGS